MSGQMRGSITAEEALDLVPLGSRWYLSNGWRGHYATVVEVGLSRDYEPAVRLHRDGDDAPMPIRDLVRYVLKRGTRQEGEDVVVNEATASPTTRRATMPSTKTGPKEAEARAQREAKATNGSKPKASSKKKGTTAIDAILAVLSESGKPMKVKDIFDAALPKATTLKGKHPRQTMYSVLYSEAKRKNPRVEQVGTGTFKLKKVAS